MAIGTNKGDQVLSFDYKNPLTSKSFNIFTDKLVPYGIYSGYDVTVASPTSIEISPGILYMQNEGYSTNALGLRIETTSTVTLLSPTNFSSAATYIVGVFDWQDIETWYMDFQSKTYAQLVDTDIIFGKLVYIGGVLTHVDTTLRSDSSLGILDAQKEYFKVYPTDPISADVNIKGGNIVLSGSNKGIVTIADTPNAVTLPSVGAGLNRVDLIYLDSTGAFQYVSGGTHATNYLYPEIPKNALGLAFIKRDGDISPSTVNGKEIEIINIYDQSNYFDTAGIPEWVSTDSYLADYSIVQVSGNIYIARTGTAASPNVGNNPASDITNWRKVIDKSLVYLESNIFNINNIETRIKHTTNYLSLDYTSATVFQIDPIAVNNTDATGIQIFRITNTSGNVNLDILVGNGTATTNCRLGGNIDSFLNASTGNVGIGINATIAQKLHVKDTTNDCYIRIETDKANGEAGVEFLNDAITWGAYVSSTDWFAIKNVTSGNNYLFISNTGITQVVAAVTSTSKDTGALVVTAGGLGVEENINAGGNITATGNLNANNGVVTSGKGINIDYNEILADTSGIQWYAGNGTLARQYTYYADITTGNTWRIVDGTAPASRLEINSNGTVRVKVATSSTTKDTGALIIDSGGLGVEENINAGGNIVATGSITAGGTSSANILQVTNSTNSTSKDTGALIVTLGGLGVEGNIYNGGNIVATGNITATGTVTVNSSTNSTTKDTGALIVSNGGLGVEGNIYNGGNLNATGTIRGVGGEVIEYRDSSGTETTATIKKKIIEIGDWDMDTVSGVFIYHGLTDNTKIRNIYALLREDAPNSDRIWPLVTGGSLVIMNGGSIGLVTASQIALARLDGGIFDSTSLSDTSYNRGWIYIEYEA